MDAKPFFTQHRTSIVTLLLLAAIVAFGYGAYSLWTYSLPMAQHKYALAAASDYAGDKPEALYDVAIDSYRQGNYGATVATLKIAYSRCNDKSGKVPESRQELASNIQLLMGNALVKMQKPQPAIEAYQQSLRHNPDNLYAKYNLELLWSQSPPPSSGGGGANGPASGTHGAKKGI